MMEAKEIWEKACKKTLEDISKAFTDEENLIKFSDRLKEKQIRVETLTSYIAFG